MILTKLEKWLHEYDLLNAGEKFVLACSGGPDSLVLVHAMHALQAAGHLQAELKVAHVNHMFRSESVQEAEFVREFCRQRALPCAVQTIDVPACRAVTGESAQTAARRLRYEYLWQVADEWGQAKLVTAHQRDDQAETVLLHLLRGAGGSGLQGILPVNGRLLRPLLAVSREEINVYWQEQALHPCQDPSNLHTDYLRNKVRLELLPALEAEYNPRLREALCRTATLLRAEHEYISTEASKLLPGLVNEQAGKLQIKGAVFNSLPVALRREIIRQIIAKKNAALTGISYEHVEKVLEMICCGVVGSLLFLPGNIEFCKTYTGAEFSLAAKSLAECRQHELAVQKPQVQVELNVPGVLVVPALAVIVSARLLSSEEQWPVEQKHKSAKMAITVDKDQVSFPLLIRNRQSGDHFSPQGMSGSKKLKKFLIDAKIPRAERDSVPLLCDQQGILWVVGLRQAQHGMISAETKNFLLLEVEIIPAAGEKQDKQGVGSL